MGLKLTPLEVGGRDPSFAGRSLLAAYLKN